MEFRFRIIRDAKKNKAESGEAESGEIVKIACRFDGTYGVRKDFQPTEEQIQAFHRGNAIFNCWPYFREYVQSTVGRLNYPPLTVPFLRLMPKPPAANSISAIKEAKPPKKREAKRISAPKS